jgi:hypothetical protein
MEKKIKKIGSIQKTDSKGYIINDFSLENIQKDYLDVLELLIEMYKENYSDILHSVYIRGSVLKGLAVRDISDIDTVAIVKRELTEDEYKIAENIEKKIVAKHPYLNGAELLFQEYKKVSSSVKFQFLLKTQTRCVYGTDLTPELPNFKIGSYSYVHSDRLEEDVKIVEQWLENIEDLDDIKEICLGVMKRIVRIGFEVVMSREQYFTRDLYYCYEAFSKYYPEKSEDMYEVMELAVYPVSDKKIVLEKINIFKDFLIKLTKQYCM